MSTGVNSLAAIWFAELDGTSFKEKLTDKKAGITVKLLALGFGVVSYLLVFLVPFMGGLVSVSLLYSVINTTYTIYKLVGENFISLTESSLFFGNANFDWRFLLWSTCVIRKSVVIFLFLGI